MDTTFHYDVIVIGAGHAGCEAACAAARMGARTVVITMDMNKIAQMSCNPAVGGIAKGQIVREVDALGGQMGEVTDATAIQFRMLNRSKGPAMWSPRAQCDRIRFIAEWRRRLENTDNLDIWQDEVTEIITQHGVACGVRTIWGAEFHAKSIIITAGTFLNGLMHIGRKTVAGGRCAEPASTFLTDSLTALGIDSLRMKTGTPVRIDARSVHFDEMEVQPGEDDFHRFSFLSDQRALPQLQCWTCETNAEVHRVLRSGLEDSPLFNGQIQSIGPRYCPRSKQNWSLSPAANRIPSSWSPRHRHERTLLEWFLLVTADACANRSFETDSLFPRSARLSPGYAIEYDFFPPTQLHHTLESKRSKAFSSPVRSMAPQATRKRPAKVWWPVSMPPCDAQEIRPSPCAATKLISGCSSMTW